MSTSPDTIAFLEEQLSGLPIRIAPMFGEYGICRSRAARRNDPRTRVRGAKPSHAVPRRLLDDAEWLTRAVRATGGALPKPKPKPKKKA